MRDRAGREQDRISRKAFEQLPRAYQRILAARCAGRTMSDRLGEELLMVALRAFARRRRRMLVRRICLACIVATASTITTVSVVTSLARASVQSTMQPIGFHARRRFPALRLDNDLDDVLWFP